MADLNQEWRDLCRWPTPAEQARLDRLGVSIGKMVLTPGAAVQVAFIDPQGDVFDFAPAGTGKKALIVPTDLYEDGAGAAQFVDLLAFDPCKPDRWWLRLGVANWLAGYQVDRRSVSGLGGAPFVAPVAMADGYTTEALVILRTPLGWLQAGCDGAVALVPDALNDLCFLETPVTCEDIAHAEEVERSLALPSRLMPTLKVPMPAGMAA